MCLSKDFKPNFYFEPPILWVSSCNSNRAKALKFWTTVSYKSARSEGSLGENGYMYMYGWVLLLFLWNYHNVFVSWLYPNTKLEVKKQTNKHSSWLKSNNLKYKKKRMSDLIDPIKMIYCIYACVHMIHKYFQQIVNILNIWKLAEIKMNNRRE